MIKQRAMGRTGLNLSELCLGTLNFGWTTNEASSYAILDAYHAAGGSFIQGSSSHPNSFLPSASTSRSEEIVGSWWTTRRIPRQSLFLTTRIQLMEPRWREGDSINVLRTAMQESMRRLRTDYIDLVIFEWSDCFASTAATLEGFDSIVQSGDARFIGAANFPVWRAAESLGYAKIGNLNRIEALQTDYSLMTRARFEPEMMEFCKAHQIGFFASSPLAGGFLARGGDLNSILHSVRHRRLAERFDNVYGELARSAVATVAARHGASFGQVAIAWVIHNPTVTSAVIGVNTIEQLNELVRATSLSLTRADLEDLESSTVAEEVRVS